MQTGDDDSVLFKCHAGCAQDAVIAALTEKGLWGVSEKRIQTSDTGLPLYADSKVVATYDYRDREGNVVFRVTRYLPKDFRQSRPDGKGGWIKNLDGVTRVLYRLPEVIAAVERKETVFIVEGEKDADNLSAIGLCATTSSGGAGKWDDRYATDLVGANVVLAGDRDDAGRAHIKDVAQSLSIAARSVRILDLPGTSKDISDWLAAGGSKLALESMVDDLPEWESSEKVIWTPRDLARDFREVTNKRQAGDKEFIGFPVGFKSLDKDLVYSPGDMWLIAAATGVGKSTLLQELERRATVPTIFFSVEMSRQQLMDRTIAANAGIDSWKVRRGQLDAGELASVMAEVDDYERREDHLLVENAGLTTAALESILRIARVRFGVRIAFLDYIQRLADKGDSEYARVTAISNAVARIARQTGVCIVAAAQVNRDAKDGQPPRSRDLRDSGYLEQDAAVILAIGRAEDSTDFKIIVRKSRSGVQGFPVDLVFDAEHSRILEKSEARSRKARPAKD